MARACRPNGENDRAQERFSKLDKGSNKNMPGSRPYRGLHCRIVHDCLPKGDWGSWDQTVRFLYLPSIDLVGRSLGWLRGEEAELNAMAKKSSKASKKKRGSRKAATRKKVVKARAVKKAVKKKTAPKRPVAKRANRGGGVPQSHLDLTDALVGAGSLLAEHVSALTSASEINARVRGYVYGFLKSEIPSGFKTSDLLPGTVFNPSQKIWEMLSQLGDLMRESDPAFPKKKLVDSEGYLIKDTKAPPQRTINFFIERVCYYARIASGLRS
jgi:hypothetical protein